MNQDHDEQQRSKYPPREMPELEETECAGMTFPPSIDDDSSDFFSLSQGE